VTWHPFKEILRDGVRHLIFSPTIYSKKSLTWYLTIRGPSSKGTVNQYFKEIFKEVITNDPGLKIFKVYYCMGTGDVFYLGSIESGNIRFRQKIISQIQHEMDTEIDKDQKTIDLKNKTFNALKTMFKHSTASEPDRIKVQKSTKPHAKSMNPTNKN
jgi:hypothetical protein